MLSVHEFFLFTNLGVIKFTHRDVNATTKENSIFATV
jgi:hypothetical protein